MEKVGPQGLDTRIVRTPWIAEPIGFPPTGPIEIPRTIDKRTNRESAHRVRWKSRNRSRIRNFQDLEFSKP